MNAAFAFSIRTKGYVGGGTLHRNNLWIDEDTDAFWEYNPATDAWTQKSDYIGDPMSHGIAIVIKGKGYVGLGLSARVDFYEYNPETNIWTRLPDYPGAGAADAIAFAIGNLGYIGGGASCMTGAHGMPHSDFWEYDPANKVWTQRGDLGTAVHSAGVFAIDDTNNGYVCGGNDGIGAISTYQRYDVGTGLWSACGNLPGVIEGTAGFILNGKGYLATGRDATAPTDIFYEYIDDDDHCGSWTALTPFPGDERLYAAAFVVGKKAYVTTGTNWWDHGDENFSDTWEFCNKGGGRSRGFTAGLTHRPMH